MKIKAVRVTPIAIKDPALLNAAGVHEPWGLRSIIEVEGANGLVGLGETYGDAPVLDLLTRAKDSLVGLSAFDLNGLWARVLAFSTQGKTAHVEMELAPGSLGGNLVNSAFSAFEVAFLDLQARTLGIPLVELLGGAVRNKVAYSAYLFYKWDASVDPEYAPDPYGEAVNPAQIVKQARQMIDQYGFESIKLKAGVFDPMEEADAILALKAAFPKAPLRIDPNSNWTMATSIQVANKLAGCLEYYEDPTPTLEGMAELHQATGLPLATNMVVTNWDELRRAVKLNCGADPAVRPPLLGRPARHPGAGAHLPGVRPGPVDALELAPGHQPDGHDAPGRLGAAPELRLRHALPVAERRDPGRRQGADHRRLRASDGQARAGRGAGPRQAGRAARGLQGLPHPHPQRRGADAALPARVDAGQAAFLRLSNQILRKMTHFPASNGRSLLLKRD